MWSVGVAMMLAGTSHVHAGGTVEVLHWWTFRRRSKGRRRTEAIIRGSGRQPGSIRRSPAAVAMRPLTALRAPAVVAGNPPTARPAQGSWHPGMGR